MVNQSLFTQLLKFSSRFCALIHECFCWNITFTWNIVPKCINGLFTIFVLEWNQFNPLGKMFNHNQHILVMKTIKLNGPTKSKFHWYLDPMINKGYKCGAGALNDAWTQSHTIHCETNVEPTIACFSTNISLEANYRSNIHQNVPTFHMHDVFPPL
jgi:hypothetical protein